MQMPPKLRLASDVLATVVIAGYVLSAFAGWRPHGSIGTAGFDAPLRIFQSVLEIGAMGWMAFGLRRPSPLFNVLAIAVLAPAPILYFSGRIRFDFYAAVAHAVLVVIIAFRWWESWDEQRRRA